MQPFRTGRDQLAGALQVHDVDVVFAHMLFQGAGQLRAFGGLDGDEVLDGHGVQHLTAEALGGNTGADALARGVDSRCSARRATADDQHVEGGLGAHLLGITRGSASVELGKDFFFAHAALPEQFAVEVDAGHRHHLTRFNFVLEQRTVDGDVADVGVEHGHQVQRLDHVRAVLAGQREVGFEVVFAFDVLDLLDDLRRSLGRMAAHLQQRQDQRGELVAHGQAGEAQADVTADAVERERRLARILAVGLEGDLVAETCNVLQHAQHFLGLLAVIEGRDDLERLSDLFQIGFQLGLEIGVQHDRRCLPKNSENKTPG